MITRRVQRGAHMDGIHDLGGTKGFGHTQGFDHIDVEADEPTFHQPWQRTTFALMMATQIVMRSHNTDEKRRAIQRMHPADYYESVLTGTISLLVEKGHLSQAGYTSAPVGKYPHDFAFVGVIHGVTLERLAEPSQEVKQQERKGAFKAGLGAQ